jgi:CheY-like chemotaxis protein
LIGDLNAKLQEGVLKAASAGAGKTSKLSVLLIEDNEQNLYLSTFLLERNGCKVVAARSGPEGIEMAGRIQPDLIILDIQLPQMDGYAVARELRQNQALMDVPIVAVTSYAMVGDRERTLDVGCNGYIEKPINPDTFKSEIEKYLKGKIVGGGTES